MKATKTTKSNATSKRSLQNECYDILVATLNPKSKFYSEDCDQIWAGLLKKNETELRETLNRQRAISRVTQKEIDAHCQFDGFFAR